MKKISYSFMLCFLIIGMILLLSACGGLSDSELTNIASEYKSSLENLCNEYGLTDATIEVGNSFATRDNENNIYVESATVRCDKFNDLSAEKAFSFAKDFDHLGSNYYDTDKANVSFTAILYGRDDKLYSYEVKKSPTSRYEYLMLYNNAAVTYKDGVLVYDIFSSSEN